MPIQNVTITKVYRSTNNKDGQPLVTKDGRNYEKVSIQTREHGQKWIGGFGGNWNQNWREGQTVELDIEEKGEYLNFKKVDTEANILIMLQDQKLLLGELHRMLVDLHKAATHGTLPVGESAVAGKPKSVVEAIHPKTTPDDMPF